jgi:hypothetical protein
LPSIDKKGVRKQNYQIYIPLFCHWIDYSVTHLLLCICASNVEIKPTLVVGFFSLAWLKTGADRSSLYPTTFSVTAGGSEPRIRSTVASGVTTAAEIARLTLKSGDVILTKDSETPDDIGVPAWVPEDLPGVVCAYHLGI